ncbi:phosphopantetheine-binding protein [Bosea beijingensis]|uniref:phosphopantetheine-binding protein n=1 Tax=Bosea beijingensis TaxID=3068632 RepID=UPI0027419C8F|nr:phosphopantetheine-binding protein [Bosea sp. REN20]
MKADTQGLRRTVIALLAEAGHAGPVGETESLFLSGRLDSLAAAELLALLERDHGLDLADADFDITQIDTLAQLEALASQQPA